MKKYKIPLFKMDWAKSDIRAVNKVIKSGQNWADGEEVKKLEKAISEYVGRKYGVAFNSGTSALCSLMMAYDIKKGDEVIVPSFTFIATANCVLSVGAKPVFVDIEEELYGLDPKDVERKITPRTKAIIAVHIGGNHCKIDELKVVAKKHKLILIEDACESLGATYNREKARYGGMVGSFGDSAVFSFCQNKVITGGEGGMVVTDDKKLADKLELISNHGKIATEFISLGYNFRMNTITAALILSQFKRIEKIIKKRIVNARYYDRKLGIVNKFSTDRNVFQLYMVRLGVNRDNIKKALEKEKIFAKVYFEPIHLTPFYKLLGYNCFLPITEKVSKEVLVLPMWPDISHKEMSYITKIIKDINEKRKSIADCS